MSKSPVFLLKSGSSMLLLLFGLASLESSAGLWPWLTATLFGLAILGLWLRPYWPGITLGLLLLSQGLLSNSGWLNSSQLVTMQPQLALQLDVPTGLRPGITGSQHISTDAQGFRSTTSINYRHKPSNSYRIFTIGGSTTADVYLDDANTWSAQLQQRLQAHWPTHQIEVVNTGVEGLRARHHWATLKHIEAFAPDLVIIMAGFNDWNQQAKEAHSAWPTLFHRFADFEHSLMGQMSRRFLHASRDRNGATVAPPKRLPKGSLNRTVKVDAATQQLHPDYQQFMQKILNRCQQASYQCLLLSQIHGYQPDISADYAAGLWATPAAAEFTLSLPALIATAQFYQQQSAQLAAIYQQPFCTASQHLSSSFKHFYDDCHLNTAGAAAFGHLVSQCVLERIPQPF